MCTYWTTTCTKSTAGVAYRCVLYSVIAYFSSVCIR